MFFGSWEGKRYTQIGLDVATKIDALDLADRFRRRHEIREWQNSASTAQRLEVIEWCKRIEMQELSTS